MGVPHFSSISSSDFPSYATQLAALDREDLKERFQVLSVTGIDGSPQKDASARAKEKGTVPNHNMSRTVQ
jgi:hypothetical protein